MKNLEALFNEACDDSVSVWGVDVELSDEVVDTVYRAVEVPLALLRQHWFLVLLNSEALIS